MNQPPTSTIPQGPKNTRRLRVVLLNQPFFPDVVATAQMAKDLADELASRGHQVIAVASRSIYGESGASLPPREAVPVPKGPAIDVRRVGWSVFGKKGVAARLADFGLFYLLSLVEVLSLPRPDVVVSFTTPPLIGFVGLVSRFFRGSKAVHWVMDLYPDVPVACGMMSPTGPLTRVVEWFSRQLLHRSDVNVVLGRCMESRVLGKGVAASRVARIPVWADLEGLEPTPHEGNPFRARWAAGGEFVVMYSGNFGLGHDAATILDAALRLKDRKDIRFVFVGGGKRRAEVEAFASKHGLTTVSWHGYQARADLGRSLSAGDVHLISLREGAEGAIVPSKMFGIMAVGRPALFVGHPSSEIARVITEAECGVCVREGEGEKLAQAILTLKDDPALREAMGARARAGITGRYDKATACRQWADLLEGLGAAGA